MAGVVYATNQSTRIAGTKSKCYSPGDAGVEQWLWRARLSIRVQRRENIEDGQDRRHSDEQACLCEPFSRAESIGVPIAFNALVEIGRKGKQGLYPPTSESKYHVQWIRWPVLLAFISKLAPSGFVEG